MSYVLHNARERLSILLSLANCGAGNADTQAEIEDLQELIAAIEYNQ